MKIKFIILVFTLLVPVTAVADNPQSKALRSDEWLEREWMMDVNYEFGVRLLDKQHPSYSRMRLGTTYFHEPQAYTVGAIGEIEHIQRPAAFGLQVEHLSTHYSTWLQLSSLIETNGKFRFTSGVGWQVLGVDFQYRPATQQRRWSLSGKLRVPLSWIYKAAVR